MKRLNKLVENRKIVYVLAALAAGILCVVIICYLLIGNLGIFAGFFGHSAEEVKQMLEFMSTTNPRTIIKMRRQLTG